MISKTTTSMVTCSVPQVAPSAKSTTVAQSKPSSQLCKSPAKLKSKKTIDSKRTPTTNSRPRMLKFTLLKVISQIRPLRQAITAGAVNPKWTTAGIELPQGVAAATNLCWTTLRIKMTGPTCRIPMVSTILNDGTSTATVCWWQSTLKLKSIRMSATSSTKRSTSYSTRLFPTRYQSRLPRQLILKISNRRTSSTNKIEAANRQLILHKKLIY